MRRAHTYLMLATSVTLAGGCPEGVDLNVGLGDTVPAEGQTAPAGGNEPQNDSRLRGPGFSLTIPEGFSLTQDATTQPGYTFWHFYEDESQRTGLAIGVVPPSIGGVSNLEEVSLRVKGATVSDAGDFLLNTEIQTSSFSFAMEGAVGRLADGSGLVVMVGGTGLADATELTALGVFRSIELNETDGRELEQIWRDTTPNVLTNAHRDAGLVVLDDLSVWALVGAVADWSPGDSVFPQVNQDQYELVHVGHWLPIDAVYVGDATSSTITSVRSDTITLTSGNSWTIGLEAQSWSEGDTVVNVTDAIGRWVIHAQTGRAVLDPTLGVAGPGFNVRLPQTSLEEVTDFAPPPGVEFWKAYYDEFNDAVYAIASFPATTGGVTSIEDFTFRIRGAVTTNSGDFMVLTRTTLDGEEADMAFATLPGGRRLGVYVLGAEITGALELAGFSLFTSVELTETDGRELEEEFRDYASTVLVDGSNGMTILEDLSVWVLPFDAPNSAALEFNSWSFGDHIGAQEYEVPSGTVTELIHVGNWVPVEVESEGIALEQTVAEGDGDILTLSDGSSFRGAPQSWAVGDTLYVVDERFGGTWLISESGTAIEFF